MMTSKIKTIAALTFCSMSGLTYAEIQIDNESNLNTIQVNDVSVVNKNKKVVSNQDIAQHYQIDKQTVVLKVQKRKPKKLVIGFTSENAGKQKTYPITHVDEQEQERNLKNKKAIALKLNQESNDDVIRIQISKDTPNLDNVQETPKKLAKTKNKNKPQKHEFIDFVALTKAKENNQQAVNVVENVVENLDSVQENTNHVEEVKINNKTKQIKKKNKNNLAKHQQDEKTAIKARLEPRNQDFYPAKNTLEFVDDESNIKPMATQVSQNNKEFNIEDLMFDKNGIRLGQDAPYQYMKKQAQALGKNFDDDEANATAPVEFENIGNGMAMIRNEADVQENQDNPALAENQSQYQEQMVLEQAAYEQYNNVVQTPQVPQQDVQQTAMSNIGGEGIYIPFDYEQYAQQQQADLPKVKESKKTQSKKGKGKTAVETSAFDNHVASNTNSSNSFENQTVVLNDVQAIGLKNVNPMMILQTLGLDRGSEYVVSEENSRVLKEKLLATGFFKSMDLKVDANKNLILQFEEQPVIREVKANGGKMIKNKAVETMLKENHVHEGGVFNPLLLNQHANSLKEELSLIGKQEAKVDVEIKPVVNENQETEVAVQFNIDEGETTKINKIQFQNNEVLSSKKLTRLMKLDEKNWRSQIFRTNRLNQHTLRSDLEKIVNHYQNNGYLMANVENVEFEQVDTKGKKKEQNVKIILNEGKQFHFLKPNVSISPNVQEILTPAELDKLIVFKENELYNKDKVVQSSENIKKFLSNRGYALNDVELEFEPVEVDGKNMVQFNMAVKSGNQVQIRNVTVSGNKKTKTETVLQNVKQKTGEIYDLSKLQVSKDKLNQTGYFAEVDMQSKPVSENEVDINIDVKERRTGSLQASLGYMQDYGIALGLSAEDKNFMGSGKTVGANISHNKIQKNAEINYYDPYFLKNGTSLDLTAFGNSYDPTKQKDNLQNYKTNKYGLSATLGIPTSDYNKFYAGLNLSQMRVDTFQDAPKQYREFIQSHGKFDEQGNGKFKGMVNKLLLGWGTDTTNDAYWATKGYTINTNAEVTLPSSKFKFWKANVNGNYYIPVGKQSAVKFGGSLGMARSFGKTKDIPFFENFYGGGLSDTNLRGLETGSLGAKVFDKEGNMITYGGNNKFAGNIEFMTPVPFIKDSSNVRLSAFVDVASIWNNKKYTPNDSDNGVSVYNKPVYHSNFKNELRTSAGLAWTWLSPMGAIKFSYAQPLNKKAEDQTQKFQFQIGTTF